KGGTTYQLYALSISQSGVFSQPIKLGEVAIALNTTVTAKPTASAVYGTALANITLSGGTVTAEGNTNVAGKWAWTQANSDTIFPEVGGTTTYEVTFTPTDRVYKPVTAQVTPVVTAKTVTVTPTSGQSIEYGATSGLTFITSDSGAEASITGALALANANVGTQNITIGTLASSSANYTLVLSETAVTATVTAKPVELSWTKGTGFIYNAVEQSVTATITNKVNSDDVAVGTYTGNTGTNVGTYHAQALTLSGAAKGNYTLEGVVSNVQTLTITAATPTVAVTAEKKVSRLSSLGNHEDTITLKATVTGVAGGTVPTGTITFKSGATTIASDVEVINGVATYEWVTPDAANHTITAEFVATADTNYANATGTSAFDIDKADQAALNIGGVPNKVIYGDGNFTLSTTGGSGTGDVTYAVTAGSDVVSVVESTGVVTVLKAGTATITAAKAGDGNYNAKTGTVEITVQGAKPTVTWGGNATQTVTYTGSEAVITAPTATGVTGGTTPNGTISYTYEKKSSFSLFTTPESGLPVNAGTYTVTAHIAAEGNYTAADSATMELTINKSTPSLAISTMNGKT
ncbi:MAG: Ig-like domain repeat protein, partial [Angelakisella sp.]